MKLTDEQLREVGEQVRRAWPIRCGDDEARLILGRAAVAAVAPLLLAEPSDDELRKVGGGHLWRGADFVRCKDVFRDRLASLTAKPDPAADALRDELRRQAHKAGQLLATGVDYAALVAAVDAARAK